MAIKLTNADHRKLDKMIDTVLEAHAQGEVSLVEARASLAHVITAAAIGNEGELRAWLKPETAADWKDMIKVTKS